VPIVVALAATVAAGMTCLPLPFTGDQALFVLGGRAVADGTPLYTGFWDLKQPGIFVFYRVAGAVFGDGEVGVHLLELCWMAALALLVVAVFARRLATPWPVAAAPLLTVGVYYAIASPLELTQVEGLVGLPVLAAVVPVVGVAEPGDGDVRFGRLVVAGAMAAVVAAFKLMLVAVPVLCWAALLLVHRPPRRGRVAAALAVGLAVPTFAFVAWAGARGLLGEIWHTWVEVPPGVPARAGRPLDRLAASVVEFGKLTAPVLVLAAFGVRRAWGLRRDALALAAVVWLAVGAVSFLVQLWWSYLLYVLVVPLGLLAVFGLDDVWTRRREWSRWAASGVAVAVLVLSGFVAVRVGRRVVHLADDGLALDSTDRLAFRVEEYPLYGRTRDDAARYLGGVGDEDDVVVLGNPLYLYLSGRAQAIGVNGWSLEHVDARLWRRTADELAAARPTVIFVDDFYEPFLAERGAAVVDVIERDYEAFAVTDDGTWYRRS
jgi:hypothetical protein